jgi:uncharacterized protein with beta-barrel porin domain
LLGIFMTNIWADPRDSAATGRSAGARFRNAFLGTVLAATPSLVIAGFSGAVLTALTSTSALAGDGVGGNGGDSANDVLPDRGGSGGVGVGSPGQPGSLNDGSNASGSGGGGGAAGGGAGGDGGRRDIGFNAGVGIGATTPGANGASGTNVAIPGGGTGGGGGAGGANGTGIGTAQNGGNGGSTESAIDRPVSAGGGGGGGGGGYGNVITGMAGANTAAASFGGGRGGGGGFSKAISSEGILVRSGGGGGGGSGGAALLVDGTSAGASYAIGSGLNLSGGNGGNGGFSFTDLGGASGPGGNGGAGGTGIAVTGSNGLIITNAGTIQGGNGGSGGSSSHFQVTGFDFDTDQFTGVVVPGVSGTAGNGGEGINGANLIIINSGTITGGMSGDNSVRANAITFTGGTNSLTITSSSVITGNVIAASSADTFGLGGATNSSFDLTQLGPAGQYQGFGILQKSGTSTWTVFGTPGTPLAYQITAGALDLNGATQGATSLLLTGGTLQNGTLTSAGTFDVRAGSVSAALAGTGGATKTTTGTVIFSGVNTYTGATSVNGGALVVDGSILSATTVNSGGALSGGGTIFNNVAINSGGTLAPGNATAGTSLTVQGNLAFQSAAIYLLSFNGAAASSTMVNGSATLGGASVRVANGSTITKGTQYTILHADGGVSGTFNPQVRFGTFVGAFSYDADDVFLSFTQSLLAGASGLNVNQQHVANAIDGFFNGGGALPAGFVNLPGLSGAPLGNALTQISGETATGSQQTTFNAMNQFMGVLTDPFMDRAGAAGAPQRASGYADEALGYAASAKQTDALAMFSKASLAAPFEQRWSTWVAGYGGSQTTDGNTTLGSNTATSRIAGSAVGADYRFSPNMIAGFALAGGGTNFSVANSGSGRSDLFQVGAYVRHTQGPAYFSAVLAYGWQDITTDRTVTVAGIDHLHAEFNANAFSGRVEGGYRFVSPWMGVGITPYAAGQFTTFDLPAYAEQAIVGSNTFALAYGAKSVTDPRSELGFRADKSFAMPDGVLTLRGRLAWAHDYDPNRSIGATFQTLPGASFVVNGAAQASDSALVTASAEKKWTNGWSAAATFEGEFSQVTSSYAGKGVVRYAW